VWVAQRLEDGVEIWSPKYSELLHYFFTTFVRRSFIVEA